VRPRSEPHCFDGLGGASGESGQRESTESWATVLRDLKSRGLEAPKLTVADGHLGIWSALAQVWPESAEQRCWNHKLRNVLDVVPEKAQLEVKVHLQRIASAESRAAAERERRNFRLAYQQRLPKAVERLERDWERMVAYYAFPCEHWRHLRTTNVVESPFDAVRLRTSAAKRFNKVENATALIWRLLLVVEQHFRKLNAPHLAAEVYAGVAYQDGRRVVTAKAQPSPKHPKKVAA
jgi:transposase-like protein